MVVSLNPWDGDHRYCRGRYTNAEIGERMVAAHCYSLLKLKRLHRRGDRAQRAVRDLLKVAKRRARATRKTIEEVLCDHRDALDARTEATSKFLLQAKDDARVGAPAYAIVHAMQRQDERRAALQLTGVTYAAALRVEAEVNARLKPPSAPSVLALPPPHDSASSICPAADRLRALAPPTVPHPDDVLLLTYRPSAPAPAWSQIPLGLALPPPHDSASSICPAADRLRALAPPTVPHPDDVLLLTYRPSATGPAWGHNPLGRPRRTATLNVSYHDPDPDARGPKIGGDRFAMRRR